MASPLSWQCIGEIEWYNSQEDDDSIIYNPLSGQTHQLNLIAVDSLKFLQQPASLAHLTQHICTLYQIDNSHDIHLQMMQLIEQFDDLGLIKPYLS